MRPFRNHGWEHYDKVQVIIPGNRARGTFAFRATASPCPTTNPDEAAESSGTSMAPLPPNSSNSIRPAPEVTSSSSATGGDMDMDAPFLHQSEPSLTSSAKRSFAALSESGRTGTDLLPLESHSAGGSGPADSDPAVKRVRVSKAGRPAKAVTQATAVVGMQGSINRLTDIFERSQKVLTEAPPPPPDRTLERKDRALKLVQERDDGFTVEDKVTLISIFEENPGSIDTYLGLVDPEIRRSWISRMLEKV